MGDNAPYFEVRTKIWRKKWDPVTLNLPNGRTQGLVGDPDEKPCGYSVPQGHGGFNRDETRPI